MHRVCHLRHEAMTRTPFPPGRRKKAAGIHRRHGDDARCDGERRLMDGGRGAATDGDGDWLHDSRAGPDAHRKRT